MPRFTYTARSASGEKVQGTVETPDRRAALLQIERQGLVPVSVREAAAASAVAQAASGPRFQVATGVTRKARMRMRDTLTFTRELGDLIQSGMTLGNALNTLSRRHTKTDQDRIVVELRDEIVRGASLSDALGRYPETFSTLYISMVRAGEASGTVTEAFDRLVKHYERVLAAREKVVGAMIYPAIVVVVGLLTIIFTMTYVIPKFSKVFGELGATLPLPTRMLIGISSFVLTYGWMVAIAAVAITILVRRYIRTDAGERQWHRLQMRLPVFRRIVTANAFSQFARTLGALLANGVPVLQALSIVEQTVGNRLIAEEIRNARDRVTDGSTISGPLAAGKVFPPLLTDMMAVGEQSGDMSAALGHIARRYEEDLDRSIKLMTTVLEPAMILGIAVGVGFVAMSMLMAVFSLTSGLNV